MLRAGYADAWAIFLPPLRSRLRLTKIGLSLAWKMPNARRTTYRIIKDSYWLNQWSGKMLNSYMERAEAMLPEATLEELEVFAPKLQKWAIRQAQSVRGLGRIRLIRGVMTLSRHEDGVRLECMFYGERSDAMMIELIADGGMQLGSEQTSRVPDAEAAHVALAVLLDELEMSVMLG